MAFFFLAIHKGSADVVVTVTPHKVLSDIEIVSRETGYSTSTLNRIIYCESRGNPKAKHLNHNGTTDYGLAQINEVHIPEARALGFDITTRAGNLGLMAVLIKKNGLRDWSASKSCWSYPQDKIK